MAGSSAVFKTLAVSLAGLYMLKVVSDTAPPRVTTSHIHDKSSNATNHTPTLPVYDNTERSLKEIKKYVASSSSDACQRAMNLYEEAFKKMMDAKKEMESKLNEGSSHGFDSLWASKNTVDDALKKKYDEAVSDYEHLKKNIGAYEEPLQGENKQMCNKAQRYIERAKSFFKGKYADLTSNKQFAADQLKETVRYYSKQTVDAKAEWDATRGSWLSWEKAQSQEIQDRAEAKYNYFRTKNEEYTNQLLEYLKESGEDAKQVLDELTSQGKDHVFNAKEIVKEYGGHIIDGASQQYKNVENFAQNARDHLAAVGYGAKEPSQFDPEHANNYATDDTKKDQENENEPAYAAKEAVRDNAKYVPDKLQDQVQYIKDSAIALKDSAAKVGEDLKYAVQDNAASIENDAGCAEDKAACLKEDVYDALDGIRKTIEDNVPFAKDSLGNAKALVEDNAVYAEGKAYNAGKEVREAIEREAAYVKSQAHDASKQAKDSAEGIAAGASKWFQDTGSATRGYLTDKYNDFWNHLGVFSTKNKEAAEEAVKYYEKEVRKATAEFEATKGGWFGIKREQPQEVQDTAREKLEILKAKDDAARKELERWQSSEN